MSQKYLGGNFSEAALAWHLRGERGGRGGGVLRGPLGGCLGVYSKRDCQRKISLAPQSSHGEKADTRIIINISLYSLARFSDPSFRLALNSLHGAATLKHLCLL